MRRLIICLLFLLKNVVLSHRTTLTEVFSWKQIGYEICNVKYRSDSDYLINPLGIHFKQDLNESERFFIQYNNVPIGLEVYQDIVFVTVPRRRFGIPSTLNYIHLSSSSPLLKPFPSYEESKQLISVYRPRVDLCHRLWMIDTGLLEVPNARRQIQPPSIVIYDLKTRKRILKYELKQTDLVNERTSGGLTSITVDVSPSNCDDAFAYINDLATGTMVVFSLRQRDSWNIDHPSFKFDESSLNFSVAGNVITWRDNLFSIALSDPDEAGGRKAYFHPMVSLQEYSVDTAVLKTKGSLEGAVKLEGTRGPTTQSGSHAYHSASKTLLFANVAQDAILCWNVDKPLTPENVAIIAQDGKKLLYIADLKISGDDVWVLVNQIPRFVFSSLNPNETNFYIHRGTIKQLVKGTVCDNTTSK